MNNRSRSMLRLSSCSTKKSQLGALLNFFESRLARLGTQAPNLVNIGNKKMGYVHKISWKGNLVLSKNAQLWQKLSDFCTWTWLFLTEPSLPLSPLPCCFLISYHCNITSTTPTMAPFNASAEGRRPLNTVEDNIKWIYRRTRNRECVNPGGYQIVPYTGLVSIIN